MLYRNAPLVRSHILTPKRVSRTSLGVPSRRNFSGTRPGQASFSSVLDACCSTTQDALLALHSTTGLPWALTLPLAALLVRTTFVLPLDVWSRHHRNRAILVRPLLSAWRPILQRRIFADNAQLGQRVTHKLFLQAFRAKRKELYAKLGVRTSATVAPLLQLPVFLVVIESIRRLCGTGEGLLGLVVKSISSIEGTESSGEIESAGNNASASAIDAAAVSVTDAAAITDTGATTGTALEPSLATEGALWFPDLLVADPQLILPFALSAALFTNLQLNKWQMAAEGIEPSKGSVRLTRVLQLVALAVGPATLSVPSALLLYWVTSSTTAVGLHLLLARYMPRPLSPDAGKLKPK